MQSQQHIVFYSDLPARKATLLYAYETAFDEAHLPEQRKLLKSCCTGIGAIRRDKKTPCYLPA